MALRTEIKLIAGAVDENTFLIQGSIDQPAKILRPGPLAIGIQPAHEKSVYNLTYSEFVVPLVKAVQEQHKQAEALKKQVEAQQKQIEQQQQMIEQLLEQIE